jgi:class 3 adenylate cyclase
LRRATDGFRVPLYMDRHEDLNGVTVEEVAAAHMQDLEIQDRYDVRYLTYWLDPDAGSIFCLVDAPSMDAAETVHRESHGLVASKIIEVDHHLVQSFLGHLYEPEPGEPWAATAFRVILFTDIEDSTRLTNELGDVAALQLIRDHDQIVRDSLKSHGGTEVKHTGDGIMASFTLVSNAAECATEIQRRLDERNKTTQPALNVRIGVSAGEPVTEQNDLYGAVVTLAARLCEAADPGGVLVASTVRDLALGKGFRFQTREPVLLKGFDEPIQPFALECR